MDRGPAAPAGTVPLRFLSGRHALARRPHGACRAGRRVRQAQLRRDGGKLLMRRHCSWIASACALAAALVAGRAAGQDPRLTRLPPEAQAPVGALVDSARAAGLPAEPLVQRALEGATKQAPGDLIVAAVQRLAADLGRARDALGSTASPPGTAAAAAAADAAATAALQVNARARGQRPGRP